MCRLKLPFYKKVINYFSRHLAKKKAPVLKKKDLQLIKNFDSSRHKKLINNHNKQKLVREPTWDEMAERRKFIRVESWSWNQHLIDYGDDLSNKKKPPRMSILQSLRRRLSTIHIGGNKLDYGEVSQTKIDDQKRNGKLFERGYSSAGMFFILFFEQHYCP